MGNEGERFVFLVCQLKSERDVKREAAQPSLQPDQVQQVPGPSKQEPAGKEPH